MADVLEEEHQVARLQLAAGDVLALVPLVAGEVLEADPDVGVGPHHQAGAVEGAGAGGTPDVSVAEPGQRPLQGLLAERVASDLDVRVVAGLLEDGQGLAERGAVQHVLLGLDLADLLAHHPGERGGLRFLLRRRLLGAVGGVLGRLQQAHRAALLVLQLQHDRRAVQELLRVRGLQYLDGRVEAPGHVTLRGNLAELCLPGTHGLVVALRRLLGDRGFLACLGQLNLQRVVLLAERVDLVGQGVGFRHELLQGLRRARRGCAADAAGQSEADRRGRGGQDRHPSPRTS